MNTPIQVTTAINKLEIEEPAVEMKDVSFYYATPTKIPIFKNTKLPFLRVKTVKTKALNNITLSLRKNRVTALLGRNGSGKTTLIKLITGERIPHAGTIQVFGQAPRKVKSRIGMCLGTTLVYYRLTGRENLQYFGRLYSVKDLNARIKELTTLLGLYSKLDQLVESYSFGMKAKLALARSMIHSPEILILDEPTLGIDIEVAKQLREFIAKLNCTVLLTTHYMEEADELADDLCLINSGSIIAYGEKKDVLAKFNAQNVPDAFRSALIMHRPIEATA